MVVQHNLTAMNSNRMLGITQGQQAKSSEKLSSGYQINRAADDAAGLTISEKMRKQIKGLDRASTNAEDGVSAVQTAEGALTEVHSMLQRMNELAVQAANGTNSESDREAIQAEVDQLLTEIDRVAETTKFNETYLLKGNPEGVSTTMKVAAHDAGLAGKLDDNGDGTFTFKAEDLAVGDKVTIAGKEYSIVDSADVADYIDSKDANTAANVEKSGNKLVKEDGTSYTYYEVGDKDVDGNEVGTGNAGWYKDGKYVVANKKTTANIAPEEGDTLFSAGKAQSVVGSDKAEDYTISTIDEAKAFVKGLADGDTVEIDGTGYTIGTTTVDGTSITADDAAALITEGVEVTDGTAYHYVLPAASENDSEISLAQAYEKMAEELGTASSIGTDTKAEVANNGDGTFTITQGSVEVKKGLEFGLHVGADADMTNKIGVKIDAMSTAGLGIKGLDVTDATGAEATYAIDAIADAVAKVSSQRSALGAVQNRLEHTIANLDNVVENTTAAESRIRDTDMASEMVEFSKNNILAQAGQSMLAQANQSTQGVLSLLG